MKNLFNIKPEKIACDLHPDYISTEYALNRAKEDKIPLCFIQHHHAHLASCIADNNIDKEVIGVIWDGTGYGTDGTIWGGEFLKGSYIGFERLGTIKPIHIVGGDKAIKEIYRVGYSVLYETYNKIPEDFKFNEDIFIIEKMLKKGINAPLASSIGRLFDAVASIINIKQIVSYEGQGAVLVESLAEKTNEYYEYKIENINGIFQFDWTVVIDQIVSDIKKSISKGLICSKFMNTLAKVSADIVEKIGSVTGIEDVVLSGGVFQNMYLLPKVKGCIEKKGFKVYCHNRVSTNDEGISFRTVFNCILWRGSKMCLAVPLKITKINGKDAIGESYGFKKNIRIDFIKDVKIGDYVIVHAGFAIEKIEEEVALENLKMIKEVADALGRIQ